ncbi:MAG TPA: dienelactone hydrolase family protein [Atopostipes sp.]|nr:dienelactone hydrolase family protein [Atopostipes sp.]
MIELKHEQIDDIPVIELFEKGKEQEKLPVVFFYHGWESRKERVLEYGYYLANSGFRAILPEALNHGERKQIETHQQDPLNFWEVVGNNVRELPHLVEFYLSQNKIDSEKIGVAGLSMGGITTSAILTQYEWVQTAAVLMGSPSPIDFTEWLLKNYKIDHTPIYEILDPNLIQTRLVELEPIALNLQPEKIANRPIYVWHGSADPVVPMHLTKTFFEEIKDEAYSQNVEFEVSEGVGHSVPQNIVQRMTDHFLNHL